MNNHTCGYKIELDAELLCEGKTYFVFAEASVEFDGNVDVQAVEVTKCEIQTDEGMDLKWSIEDGRYDKIVVEGHSMLTESIEKALDAEIQTFAEDNCRFIGLDVAEDYDSCYAEWNRE